VVQPTPVGAAIERTATQTVAEPTAALLRRGLVGLAAVGTVGTALELALLRHWNGGLQVIPFAALGVLGLAIGLVARRPSARSIRVARILAMVVLVTSVVGVFVHVQSNYEAAPLDFRYTDSWPTTSEPVRWLLALTDTVGPSPSLAPLAMAFVAVALLLAALRHPALSEAD
jgi:hypothetical protein